MISVSVGDDFVIGSGITVSESVVDVIIKLSEFLPIDETTDSMLDSFERIFESTESESREDNLKEDDFKVLGNMEEILLHQSIVNSMSFYVGRAEKLFKNDLEAMNFLNNYVRSIGGVVTTLV